MQNFRRARAGLTGDVNDVFDRNRYTAEWKIDIGLFRFLRRRIEIDRKVSVDFGIDIFNARAQSVENIFRGNFPATKPGLQIGDGKRRHISGAHSTTLVTMKS